MILYGSQYGTARQYAEKLASITSMEVQSFDRVQNINQYDTIVYIGGLYAGGVMGMKQTFSGLKTVRGKKILIATVGLADPAEKENTENILRNMKRQLPDDVFSAAKIFHLRGGIDYSKLNFKHKTMMGLLYQKAKRIPEEEKTAEVKALIETYNTKVSFVDFESLKPMVHALLEE